MAEPIFSMKTRQLRLGILFSVSILVILAALVVCISAPIGAADRAIGDSFSATPRLPWEEWRSSPDHPGKLLRRLEVDGWLYRLVATQESESAESVEVSVPVIYVERNSINCFILCLASCVPLVGLVFWAKLGGRS